MNYFTNVTLTYSSVTRPSVQVTDFSDVTQSYHRLSFEPKLVSEKVPLDMSPSLSFLSKISQLSSSRDFLRGHLKWVINVSLLHGSFRDTLQRTVEWQHQNGGQFPLCPNEQEDHCFISFIFGGGL